MIRALAIKELRESAAIIVVAALAVLWLLGILMGWRFTPLADVSQSSTSIPIMELSFLSVLIFGGGALATVLGLRQTVRENIDNRWYYLLHRPLARRHVLLVKIGVGLFLVLFFTAGPLLIYANWAATPGNHATPFFWGMTSAAWFICSMLPSIYLGAVLSGLRPARWFGTRLFPLVGSCMLAWLTMTLGWGWGIASLLVLDLVLLNLILATADQRDY